MDDTSFSYHAKGNIFFIFPNDTLDRRKFGTKKNTVAQCLNRIVHIIYLPLTSTSVAAWLPVLKNDGVFIKSVSSE